MEPLVTATHQSYYRFYRLCVRIGGFTGPGRYTGGWEYSFNKVPQWAANEAKSIDRGLGYIAKHRGFDPPENVPWKEMERVRVSAGACVAPDEVRNEARQAYELYEQLCRDCIGMEDLHLVRELGGLKRFEGGVWSN